MATSKEKWGADIGVGDLKVQTNICKINKLQGYMVQHREIQPLFYNNFK